MRNKEIFRKDQPLQEGLYWMKWRRKDSSFHEFKEQVLLYKEQVPLYKCITIIKN